jgi:energy-coupling factor transporter ATP-binding protein EcfA2
MAHFPLLQHLSVRNYGLYPGRDRDGVFEVAFGEGLTLILGANGLGKTTLMTMAFRMVAGTYDLLLAGEIGSAILEAHELNRATRRQFADRVNDGAKQARAILKFSLGDRAFEVERSLADLSLMRLVVDGSELSADEKIYQTQIETASGLGAYSDWLLVLRTLVFFFEDRRALVWDPGAQRQLLRCLFLSRSQASEWSTQEGVILRLDSRMRNLQAALHREQKEQRKTMQQLHGASNIRAAVEAAQASLEALNSRHADLVASVQQNDEERQKVRLNALRAQSDHDSALRELERVRLLAIAAHLPHTEESMQFLYARLMSDETCLACGTHGLSERRAALVIALEKHHCLVCESALPKRDDVIDIGDKLIEELQGRVEATHVRALDQADYLNDVNMRFQKNNEALTECTVERNDIEDSIRSLVSQLPPEQRKVIDQHDRLEEVEKLVVQLRAELQIERTKFVSSLDDYRSQIQINAEAIKEKFRAAANGFLFEESGLSWAPVSRTIGQAGGMDPVEYPGFAVELSGSDFVGLQRRASPSQVSESQREFIDLAFRMALIDAASPDHAGTIAVDAPESSLDAVFVDKAAEVLSSFATAGNSSRLIITSNLGAGELVPQLLRASAPAGKRMDAVVNLFDAGVPTRAMIESKADYDRYWNELRAKVDGDRGG